MDIEAPSDELLMEIYRKFTSFGCHHFDSYNVLFNGRAVKYNHFELKNIGFDTNKVPMLCQTYFLVFV